MKIIIFAGTTEGRQLAAFLSGQGLAVTVSVATEYGRLVMEETDGIQVRVGRMDKEAMAEILPAYDYVIDATHPYARAVSINLGEVMEEQGRLSKLIRVERSVSDTKSFLHVENVEEAAVALQQTEGPVLITTGSKELEAYTMVPAYQERLFVRVLPTAEAIQKCVSLGLAGRHIIAMQGPFSAAMNRALLEQFGIRTMVTKDSGKVGGVDEKIEAAESIGVKVIVIGRPPEKEGVRTTSATSLMAKWKEWLV